MRKDVFRKGMVLGIIFLFVGAGFVPSISGNIGKIVSIENSKSNATLFKAIIVPDDYPTIQYAIDNATEYDTIFIRNGTYYENLLVNKSINLIGENKYNTIIDGNGTAFVVELTADFIVINGFTVQNGGTQNFSDDGGIIADSSHNNIFGNIINNSYYGIHARHSKNNIYENIIEDNTNYGIVLSSTSNTVYKNIITNNSDNIYLIDSSENKIFDNIITKTKFGGYGILIYGGSQKNNIYCNTITDVSSGIGSIFGAPVPSGNNNISNNHITETIYWAIEIITNDNKIIGNYMRNSHSGGIKLKDSRNVVMMNTFDGCDLIIDSCDLVKIFCNNFFNSGVIFNDCRLNTYLNNYWNKPCLIKIIMGKMGARLCFNIDFFPAKKPY